MIQDGVNRNIVQARQFGVWPKDRMNKDSWILDQGNNVGRRR